MLQGCRISENGILITIAFTKRLSVHARIKTFRSRSTQIVEKRFWCRLKALNLSFGSEIDRYQNHLFRLTIDVGRTDLFFDLNSTRGNIPDKSQKIECYEIPVKIPKEIEPGSKLEFRYLNYLIKKYSNDDCDTSMNLEE